MHCGGEKGQQGILNNLMMHHEKSTFSMDLMSTRNRLMKNSDNLGPQKAGLPIILLLRVLQQSTHREKLSVAAVIIRIHYSKMVTMLRVDSPDIGDGHAATEAKLFHRFRELVTYCLGPRLNPDLLQSVLDSMDVDITLFKGTINWTQPRIILLFNRQVKPGGHTFIDLFPLKQITLWALQMALMIAIRSNTPEHLLLHFCPLTRWETTISGASSRQDIPEDACTVVRVTARATRDSSNTDRTPFFPVGQSMAKGSSMGIVTGLDIINDPLAATLFKSLTCRSQGNLMHELASGGAAVALARLPKNVRCHKDSKKNMTPSPEGRISIRSPDQDVGMLHTRAAERLETDGQSPIHKQIPKSANALGNIQHSLNPELRPLLKQWARDLSLLTTRQIAKQISNHNAQQQIIDSVGQIVRKWAVEGPSPFPILLGPIDDELTLFNLNPTDGVTQECMDSTPHRLLIGAMAIILYCDHTVTLNSICDIYLNLTEKAILTPATNIRLALAAVTLGNRLLVGLCRCFEEPCTCASQKTVDTLKFLKNSQTQIYCRERARARGPALVIKQFEIGSTTFARQKACILYPALMEGELGHIRAHCTTHGDLMARVEFKAHGTLEIPAEITFIHPLESSANWVATGPQYELGDKITTLAMGSATGIVHGFVIQPDKSLSVLVWFNETDRYQQLNPDQIKPDKAIQQKVPNGATTGGQTCLSGCTLLANPTGGIQMREVRPGTLLINKKGKQVRVTNVYFSVQDSVMVQISEHCHASITHPILVTRRIRGAQEDREPQGRTVVAAAEWHTLRPGDTLRNTTMYSPTFKPFGPRVGRYLHTNESHTHLSKQAVGG